MLMKQLAASDDNTDRDTSISVKPFEVLKISVVKRILVVPLNLQRDFSAFEGSYVVYLV